MSILINKSAILSISLGLLTLSGCATNATVDGMVYAQSSSALPRTKSFHNNITVYNVSGGQETNPLWKSQINNSGFKEAIEISLEKSHLYKKFGLANYVLNAQLIKLDQPFLGLDLKVVSEVNYQLKDIRSNKLAYNKTLTSSYTATFSDSPIAIIRLKIANEGAARANIEKLIKDLYSLKL